MQQRILTGDRPTGKLHLGHYVGSLANRARLQHEYETIILLADVQALTTHFADPALIRRSIFSVLLDNLSVGLDPERVLFVQQSEVSAIAELTVFFSMLVSVNALRHNPTIKTEAKQYGYDDLSYGFLGYPVSQAADMAFCNADLVPVGDDQLPHMEQAHKIVRRFNALYGETLKQPAALLSQTPRLVGLNGSSKMGKSLGNAIYLSDDAQTVAAKVHAAVTDTSRIAATDPGHPDICAVYAYHKAFCPEEAGNTAELCRAGQMGCVACKRSLTATLNALLAPIRDRRALYENSPAALCELLAAGTAHANALGRDTLLRVKEAMGILL